MYPISARNKHQWPLFRRRPQQQEQENQNLLTFFHASPEGRTGVSSYTGEGRHLGGIIGFFRVPVFRF
jgi:hypothetical protein